MPISEIVRNFFIPKPQMTYLIKQLVSAGLVERHSNLNDRRKIKIYLTAGGKETFQQCDEYLKNNIRNKLAHLTGKELKEISSALMKLKEIGTKLENT